MYTERYLSYCKTHGRKPKDMKVYDRKKWPGGALCGYVLWVKAAWIRWGKITGTSLEGLTDADHIDFDLWLKRYKIKVSNNYKGFRK